MDRTTAGIAIALCALVMSGGAMGDVMAGEAALSAPGQSSQFPVAVTNGARGERVLSLILALEALRVAPGVLDRPKV